jgi:hypothetical protein
MEFIPMPSQGRPRAVPVLVVLVGLLAGHLSANANPPATLPGEGSTENVPVDGPVLLPTLPRAEARESAPLWETTKPGESTLSAAEQSAASRAEQQPAASPPAQQPAAELSPPPKRNLTSAQIALRDRVRRTLALYANQPLQTQEHTATEVMYACLAFGCKTTVNHQRANLNGITCLCWNYACGGFEPLAMCDGHIAARLGFGAQERPGQLVAVLAFARVPPDYPARVGKEVRTVADLVEHEKRGCRGGGDSTWKLIGLSYYVVSPAWQNDLGETWTLERLVEEVLAQQPAITSDGGTTRLLALSYAIDRQLRRHQPLSGAFAAARATVEQAQELAFQAQNPEGSWGPRFLAAPGTSRDPLSMLHATGHVLEWLACSLPEEQLADPRMVRAVEYLNGLLVQRGQTQWQSRPVREIAGVMRGLHALAVYDERFFQTAQETEPEKPPAKSSVAPRPTPGTPPRR